MPVRRRDISRLLTSYRYWVAAEASIPLSADMRLPGG